MSINDIRQKVKGKILSETVIHLKIKNILELTEILTEADNITQHTNWTYNYLGQKYSNSRILLKESIALPEQLIIRMDEYLKDVADVKFKSSQIGSYLNAVLNHSYDPEDWVATLPSVCTDQVKSVTFISNNHEGITNEKINKKYADYLLVLQTIYMFKTLEN